MTNSPEKALKLTERLRACAEDPMWANHAEVPKALCAAAADEIERLQAEVAETNDLNTQLTEQMEAQSEKFRRLRAERYTLVHQNLALADAMGYSDRKHDLDSPEEHAARVLAERDALREVLLRLKRLNETGLYREEIVFEGSGRYAVDIDTVNEIGEVIDAALAAKEPR